jgi:hypothetical protein
MEPAIYRKKRVLDEETYRNTLGEIIEKDYFTPKRDCVINETNNYLPTSFNLIKGDYVGGPNTCATTNSCEYISNSKQR